MKARRRSPDVESESDESQGASQFEVDRIIGQQIRNGERWYHVLWAGYPMSEATWEPESNLATCPEVIDEFNVTHGLTYDQPLTTHDTDIATASAAVAGQPAPARAPSPPPARAATEASHRPTVVPTAVRPRRQPKPRKPYEPDALSAFAVPAVPAMNGTRKRGAASPRSKVRSAVAGPSASDGAVISTASTDIAAKRSASTAASAFGAAARDDSAHATAKRKPPPVSAAGAAATVNHNGTNGVGPIRVAVFSFAASAAAAETASAPADTTAPPTSSAVPAASKRRKRASIFAAAQRPTSPLAPAPSPPRWAEAPPSPTAASDAATAQPTAPISVVERFGANPPPPATPPSLTADTAPAPVATDARAILPRRPGRKRRRSHSLLAATDDPSTASLSPASPAPAPGTPAPPTAAPPLQVTGKRRKHSPQTPSVATVTAPHSVTPRRTIRRSSPAPSAAESPAPATAAASATAAEAPAAADEAEVMAARDVPAPVPLVPIATSLVPARVYVTPPRPINRAAPHSFGTRNRVAQTTPPRTQPTATADPTPSPVVDLWRRGVRRSKAQVAALPAPPAVRVHTNSVGASALNGRKRNGVLASAPPAGPAASDATSVVLDSPATAHADANQSEASSVISDSATADAPAAAASAAPTHIRKSRKRSRDHSDAAPESVAVRAAPAAASNRVKRQRKRPPSASVIGSPGSAGEPAPPPSAAPPTNGESAAPVHAAVGVDSADAAGSVLLPPSVPAVETNGRRSNSLVRALKRRALTAAAKSGRRRRMSPIARATAESKLERIHAAAVAAELAASARSTSAHGRTPGRRDSASAPSADADSGSDEDNLRCFKCKSGEWTKSNRILLCDAVNCGRGYHQLCASPPIEVIPDGDWFCQSCIARAKRQADANASAAQYLLPSKRHPSTKRRSRGPVPIAPMLLDPTGAAYHLILSRRARLTGTKIRILKVRIPPPESFAVAAAPAAPAPEIAASLTAATAATAAAAGTAAAALIPSADAAVAVDPTPANAAPPVPSAPAIPFPGPGLGRFGRVPRARLRKVPQRERMLEEANAFLSGSTEHFFKPKPKPKPRLQPSQSEVTASALPPTVVDASATANGTQPTASIPSPSVPAAASAVDGGTVGSGPALAPILATAKPRSRTPLRDAPTGSVQRNKYGGYTMVVFAPNTPPPLAQLIDPTQALTTRSGRTITTSPAASPPAAEPVPVSTTAVAVAVAGAESAPAVTVRRNRTPRAGLRRSDAKPASTPESQSLPEGTSPSPKGTPGRRARSRAIAAAVTEASPAPSPRVPPTPQSGDELTPNRRSRRSVVNGGRWMPVMAKGRGVAEFREIEPFFCKLALATALNVPIASNLLRPSRLELESVVRPIGLPFATALSTAGVSRPPLLLSPPAASVQDASAGFGPATAATSIPATAPAIISDPHSADGDGVGSALVPSTPEKRHIRPSPSPSPGFNRLSSVRSADEVGPHSSPAAAMVDHDLFPGTFGSLSSHPLGESVSVALGPMMTAPPLAAPSLTPSFSAPGSVGALPPVTDSEDFQFPAVTAEAQAEQQSLNDARFRLSSVAGLAPASVSTSASAAPRTPPRTAAPDVAPAATDGKGCGVAALDSDNLLSEAELIEGLCPQLVIQAAANNQTKRALSEKLSALIARGEVCVAIDSIRDRCDANEMALALFKDMCGSVSTDHYVPPPPCANCGFNHPPYAPVKAVESIERRTKKRIKRSPDVPTAAFGSGHVTSGVRPPPSLDGPYPPPSPVDLSPAIDPANGSAVSGITTPRRASPTVEPSGLAPSSAVPGPGPVASGTSSASSLLQFVSLIPDLIQSVRDRFQVPPLERPRYTALRELAIAYVAGSWAAANAIATASFETPTATDGDAEPPKAHARQTGANGSGAATPAASASGSVPAAVVCAVTPSSRKRKAAAVRPIKSPAARRQPRSSPVPSLPPTASDHDPSGEGEARSPSPTPSLRSPQPPPLPPNHATAIRNAVVRTMRTALLQYIAGLIVPPRVLALCSDPDFRVQPPAAQDAAGPAAFVDHRPPTSLDSDSLLPSAVPSFAAFTTSSALSDDLNPSFNLALPDPTPSFGFS